jgi:hypothetical protein
VLLSNSKATYTIRGESGKFPCSVTINAAKFGEVVVARRDGLLEMQSDNRNAKPGRILETIRSE